MSYPFQRDPELSESDFSILQHKAIEEIMDLKLKNKKEESLKISQDWVDRSNAYPNLNQERSTLEGLSKLYYFIACDLEFFERFEEALPFHKKSIDAMEKCCAISFSQLYFEVLAISHYLYARQLEQSGKNEIALSEAQKSLQLLDYLIDRPDNEFNNELAENKNLVEEFINDLLNDVHITQTSGDSELDYTIDNVEQNNSSGTEFEEWKKSLGGKSVVEHLWEANMRLKEAKMRQEKGFAGFVLTLMSLTWLRLEEKIEVKLIKESDVDRFSLYLQLEINEDTLGLGFSKEMEIYHCKLIRNIIVGENDSLLSDEVYEFEIVDIDSDFSRTSCMKHIGDKIYVDKAAFNKHIIMHLDALAKYDDQFRKTIGLEGINIQRW
jgi:hypothetical protein